MAVYMVERELPEITMEQLAAAQLAAIETSQRFPEDGNPVRYIRSTYIPDEVHCMCLLEAADAATVEDVNTAAHIPFTRIVAAMDLTP